MMDAMFAEALIANMARRSGVFRPRGRNTVLEPWG
jgi:hypothetical protein